MKYLTPREENLTWLILAAIWACGGGLAWFASFSNSADTVAGSTITAMALIVASISVALRLPILTGSPHSSEHSDQVVLMLGYAATVNWWGCLLIRSSSLVEALPATLVLSVSEYWVHRRFLMDKRFDWMGIAFLNVNRQWHRLTRALFDADPVSSSDHSDGALHTAFDSRQTSIEQDSEISGSAAWSVHGLHGEPAGAARYSQEGIDEEGRRYMSGNVRIQFEPGQSSTDVIVGFCPPFEGEPDLEFEVDHEDVIARLANCTPSGMKIWLRRAGGSDSVDQALGIELQWYAVQASLEGGGDRHRTVPSGNRLLP